MRVLHHNTREELRSVHCNWEWVKGIPLHWEIRVLATGPPGEFPWLGLECCAKELEIYPKENMGSMKISTPCMWLMSLLPSCHPMC